MNNYCTLYIARHGETEWNLKQLTQGHGDSPLTDKGKEQARALGERLKEVAFDAIFSSDLSRAKHTAEIAKLERELAVQTSELLRERSFGAYEGQAIGTYSGKLLAMISEAENEAQRLAAKLGEGDESEEEVVTRFIRQLREISVAYPGKNVLVVAHGGSIRMFLTHIGYGTYKELVSAVSNGAYVKVTCDGINFNVEEVVGITKNIIVD
jgi:broad specificity phosphatase PhoE